jgi:Transcriptional regulators
MEKEKTQGSTLAKLPYILLELINNESPESVDYIIARYILDHLTELSGASIQDISDACEVSKSTLSRFCRKAGLEDFQEMKNELQQANFIPEHKFNVPLVGSDGKGYLKKVSEQVM